MHAEVESGAPVWHLVLVTIVVAVGLAAFMSPLITTTLSHLAPGESGGIPLTNESLERIRSGDELPPAVGQPSGAATSSVDDGRDTGVAQTPGQAASPAFDHDAPVSMIDAPRYPEAA